MCLLMAKLGLALMGVVDRVEGPMVIVEWSTEEFSEIPRVLLPDAEEGQSLCLIHWRGL